MPPPFVALRLAASPLLLIGVADANVLWSVSAGKCKLVDRCIMSPNYPDKYGDDEGCTIEVKDGFQGAYVVDFETEPMFDQLVVNDRDYSGSFKPTYETKPDGGMITFISNGALAHMGFKLCPKDPKGPMWTVSGNCPKYADECITSPKFPRDYPNGVSCQIKYPKGFRGLDIVYIDADPLDTLIFDNDLALGGGIPPFLNPRPNSKISWKSDTNDDGKQVRRWKICQQSPHVVQQSLKTFLEGVDRARDVNPNTRPSPLDNMRFADDTPNGAIHLPFRSPALEVGDIHTDAHGELPPPGPGDSSGAGSPGAGGASAAASPGALSPGAYASMPSEGASESMPTNAAMAAGVAWSSPAVQSIANLARAKSSPAAAGASTSALAAAGVAAVSAAVAAAALLGKLRGVRGSFDLAHADHGADERLAAA